jgi:hypothetical protein
MAIKPNEETSKTHPPQILSITQSTIQSMDQNPRPPSKESRWDASCVYDWVSSEEVDAPSVGCCSSTASSSISLTSNLFLIGAPLACLELEFDRRRGLLVVMCSSSKMSSISSPSRPLPHVSIPEQANSPPLDNYNRGVC